MGDRDQWGNEESSDSTVVQFRETYDWSITEPSIAAIDALATVGNVEPSALVTGLDTTLYDYVDPEALDRLVGDGKPGGLTISFAVDRYRIRFEGDELVVRSRNR